MTTPPPKPGRWCVGDTGNRSSEIVSNQLEALALMSRRAQAARTGFCGVFSVECESVSSPQSAAKATTDSAEDPFLEMEITRVATSYVERKNTAMMEAFIKQHNQGDIGEATPCCVTIKFDLRDTENFKYDAFNDVSELLKFSRPAPRAHIFQRRFVHFSDAILAIRLLTAIVSAALSMSEKTQLMFLDAALKSETNEKDLERDMREVTVTDADATEKKGPTKPVVALKGEMGMSDQKNKTSDSR
jgi:hypothetical protein